MEKQLQHRQFRRELCREDYDQCEFCWTCFDDDKENTAYAFFEPDEQVWVCEKCYKDFKEYFRWIVQEIDD